MGERRRARAMLRGGALGCSRPAGPWSPGRSTGAHGRSAQGGVVSRGEHSTELRVFSHGRLVRHQALSRPAQAPHGVAHTAP